MKRRQVGRAEGAGTLGRNRLGVGPGLPCSDPPGGEEESILLGPLGPPGAQGGLRGMDWVWMGSPEDERARLLLG